MKMLRRMLVAKMLSFAMDTVLRTVLSTLLRTVRKQQEYAACHRNALGLLREWLSWAQVAEHTDVPHALVMESILLVDLHGGLRKEARDKVKHEPSKNNHKPTDNTETPEPAPVQAETPQKGGSTND